LRVNGLADQSKEQNPKFATGFATRNRTVKRHTSQHE
jgi:hypothetical protein